MKLSVVIVSFNTRELTLACLRSLYEQTRCPGGFEVIVVDNDSRDGSAEAVAAGFPRARLIRSGRNLGFAAANNLAAREASGEYLLLLNPDTVVLDAAVDRLVAFAEAHPAAGLWGGRTVFADGSLNATCCHGDLTLWSVFCRGTGLGWMFPGSRLLNRDRLPGWERDSVRGVPVVSGCCLLTRRALWERLGGFDARFDMYGEEVDFCLRARELGSRPMFTPEATIVHYGGASETVKADQVVRQFIAKVRLMRKHWSRPAGWLGTRMLDLWAASKLLRARCAGLAGRRGKGFGNDTAETWRSIWRRRAEWRTARI